MFVIDEVWESNLAVQINEGNELPLSCYVNGNPDPYITLSKEGADSGILQGKTSVQCSDMGTYKCTGISTVFTKREKTFGINITCKLFTASYILKEKKNYVVKERHATQINCKIFEIATKLHNILLGYINCLI